MSAPTLTDSWPEPLVTDRDEDMLGMGGRAVFNEARTHRYLLTRIWDARQPVMTWIMLNPSTADAFADDPTIRRCVSFARRGGCGGIWVVNLFALRATDPRMLAEHADPVGACNDQFLAERGAQGSVTVAGWGAGGSLRGRSREVGKQLEAFGVPLRCLGVHQGG